MKDEGGGGGGQQLKGKAPVPYKYTVLPGNESSLIKEALERRSWWTPTPEKGRFNFWWGGNGQRFEHRTLVTDGSCRQLVNKLEDHKVICRKSDLALTMTQYAEQTKSDTKYVPETYVVGAQTGEHSLAALRQKLGRGKGGEKKAGGFGSGGGIWGAAAGASPYAAPARAPLNKGGGHGRGAKGIAAPKAAAAAEAAAGAGTGNGAGGDGEGGVGGAAGGGGGGAAGGAAKRKGGDVWIVKPGARNRGNGIEVFNDLVAIEKHLRSQATGSQWVVQKYIENPLLIKNRKFDIRQYVLVTPDRKVWAYKDSYLRTCSKEYTLNDLTDLSAHLTNDAVQKHLDSYGEFESANKLSYPEFQEVLDARPDASSKPVSVENDLWPQIVDCVRMVFTAVLDQLNPKRLDYAFELYGFDFMVDDEFQVKLIEINTSPALFRHGRYLTEMLPGMIEEVVQKCIDPVFPPPEKDAASLPAPLDRFVEVAMPPPGKARGGVKKAPSFR